MSPRAPLLSRARAAALAVLVALVQRAVLADQLCDTMQYGNETQFTVNRGVLRVDPGMYTLEISEPNVCSESEAVGLKVTACDEGHAPRVLLLDAAHGVVVRAASPTHAAYVYVTMYCAADTDDAALESADSSTASLQSLSVPLPTTASNPDSLPLLEIETPSSTNEYLVPVALESRFSSVDHLNGPSKPTSLLSRIKDLWQDHAVPSLGQFKSHSSPGGTSSNLLGNPTSSLTDTSASSLAKHLIDLQPKQPPKMLSDRSPKWKQRPTRRPSSPWLKLRSLLDKKTRKSMSQSGTRVLNRYSDYNDPWTPYEDDPLSLQWTEEATDSNSLYTEGDPQSPYKSSSPWQNEGPNPLLSRPPKSSIKHDSKKQTRYVPPIYKEDPALLLEWKKDRSESQAPLPKLLLLLQDKPTPNQKKCTSEHSVEDTEPWWMNKPTKEIEEEAIPWQPDYLTDYTADDGDAWSYLQEPPTDAKFPHHAVGNKEPRAPQYPPSGHQNPATEKYLYYSPSPLTERPLLTSTVHNSLSWIKSSNAVPHKLPIKIKQPISKKVLEPKDDHYRSPPSKGFVDAPPQQHYPTDTYYPPNYFPSKPKLPPGPSLLPEPNLPSHTRYPSELNYPLIEPSYPSDSHYPSEPYYSSEPDYPSEPYYPSEPFLPSKPHQPSEPYFSPEHQYPSKPEHQYTSLPAKTAEAYVSPVHQYPSKPEHQYSSLPAKTSEGYFSPEHQYPSKPEHQYSSLPAKTSEGYFSPEHQYPSKPHQPSKGFSPSRGTHTFYVPAASHPPVKPFGSKPDHPSKPHYPSKPQYPLEPHYSPKNQQSSSPWNFLSELLLSHPTFRDSTHVIRIR